MFDRRPQSSSNAYAKGSTPRWLPGIVAVFVISVIASIPICHAKSTEPAVVLASTVQTKLATRIHEDQDRSRIGDRPSNISSNWLEGAAVTPSAGET